MNVYLNGVAGGLVVKKHLTQAERLQVLVPSVAAVYRGYSTIHQELKDFLRSSLSFALKILVGVIGVHHRILTDGMYNRRSLGSDSTSFE